MKKTVADFNNLDLQRLEDICAPTSKGKKTPAKSSAPDTIVQIKITKALAKVKDRTTASSVKKQAERDSLTLQQSFPMWDDDNRGVPNPFIRSGLFSVKNSDDRDFMQRMTVASLSNYSVTYTGIELVQEDLSIWLALINLARDQPMSDSVYFTGYSLIKDLGWTMNKKSYIRVQEAIARLKVTGIEIAFNNGGEGYTGSLIRDFAWTATDSNGNARWMVSFEPRVFVLFLQDTTTLLEWQTRKLIGSRATVALWLHSFYSSHRDPIPMGVEKIFELCRSESSLSSFRHTLRRSLEKLIDVGFLTFYSMDKDILVVTKKLRSKVLPSSPKFRALV